MNTSFKFVLLTLATLALMTACDDGDPVEEYHFGFVTVELLALPGTATLDVYVNYNKIDTLAAGRIIGNDPQLMLSAGETTTISFRKAGTDSLVLDTTILVSTGEKAALKIAYSSLLGINAFTSGSDADVAPDSTSFFLFNGVPDGAIADSIKVDAYLFRWNRATSVYDDTGITWTNLEKGKLHPDMVTVRSVAEDGLSVLYAIKLKNKATGQFIIDGLGSEYSSIWVEAGKREIITLNTLDLGDGLWFFLPDYAIY